MDKKITGIISYIPLVGWIIAFLAGDKEGAKFHLNQSLVLLIVALVNKYVLTKVLGLIPFIGGLISSIIGIYIIVCWILGLVYAIKEQEKELPLIGMIKILK